MVSGLMVAEEVQNLTWTAGICWKRGCLLEAALLLLPGPMWPTSTWPTWTSACPAESRMLTLTRYTWQNQIEMSRSGWENVPSWGVSAGRSAAPTMTVPVQVPAEEEVAAWGQPLFLWAVPWWKRLGRNAPLAPTASSIQSLATLLSRPRYRWVSKAICWTE